MCIPPVNAALRRAVRPFADRLPWGVVHSIPLIGETTVPLPDGRSIVLVADGYDSLASRMSWSGIDGFEPESLRLFIHLAQSSKVVLDVGSHIGLYALLAAVGRPDVTAVAFEPVPRNLRYLRTNVERNGADNITVVEAAVGATTGSMTLRIPATLRLPATATLNDRADAGEATDVAVVALDDYVAEHGLAPVDLMKIDVEGAEEQVLRGARRIIDEHRPAIICEVLHGIGDPAALTGLLAGSGYRHFLMTGDGLIEHEQLTGDPTYFHKNYLLIPDEAIGDRLEAGSIIAEVAR